MTQTEIVWIEENARGWDYRHETRELRSLKVHTCGICGTETNQWGVYYFMGYPSLHLVCPYRNDGSSDPICAKQTKLQEFQDRLYDNKGLTPREIEEIKAEIEKLKEFFNALPGDVIEP